jgi:small subunit ribosomal protein S5
MKGSTIAHEVMGEFGPSKVVMKPAAPGTGVIAGSAVRAVLEIAGIKDIRTKCLGSNTSHNLLGAAISGIAQLRDVDTVAAARGMTVENLGYEPY